MDGTGKQPRWPMVKLGDVCEIRPPKAEARAKLKPTESVSFFPMEDLFIESKYSVVTKQRTLAEVISNSYTYFAEGDVLLAKITPCFENGKITIAKNLINGIGFGSSEYIVMRPNPVLTAEWLYYALSNPYFRDIGSSKMTGSVGQKRLPKEFVEEFTLPLPPLAEQQRIVARLDAAFAAIDEASAAAASNARNARALFESYLDQVFSQRGAGWVERRLGEVCETISTGPFGTMLHKSDYVANGIPLVNPMNIIDGKIVPSAKMMISNETRNRLKQYQLKSGDIIIARRGELGRCALVSNLEEGWLCGTGSFFIRLKEFMLPELFVAFFGSDIVKSELQKHAVGATMQSLNHTILNDLIIPVPPLSLQKNIISNIQIIQHQTTQLTTIYERKVAALAELKQSLLAEVFGA